MSLFDIHTHLVPGVDDGARDVDEAVAALRRLAGAGVTAVLTTPHADGSLTLDPARQAARLDELDRGWARLMEADRPELELHRGVELMLDVPNPSPDDPRLRIAGGRCVLVEFAHMIVPPGATRPLEALVSGGWIPVLAHPERYHGAGASPEALVTAARSWRDAGAYLQVNGPALVGRYGDEPCRRATALLEAGLVGYLGSDYHARGETMIQDYRAFMLESGNHDAWALLTDTNPRRMIAGEPPLPVPPLRLGRAPRRASRAGRSWLGRLLRR